MVQSGQEGMKNVAGRAEEFGKIVKTSEAWRSHNEWKGDNMSVVRSGIGFLVLLTIGLSVAAAAETGGTPPVFGAKTGSVPTPKPPSPPTDNLVFYDNGVPGLNQLIGVSGSQYPYWAVAFNSGTAGVCSVMAYLSTGNYTEVVKFAIYGDASGLPDSLLWTGHDVYISPNETLWASDFCVPPVAVTGRFYVAVFPGASGSQGRVRQYWDNNGDQAPSGTQWRNSGSWAADGSAGDLMIRAYANLHNVGCTQITSPSGTVDSGTSVYPQCYVSNFGDYQESYYVKFKVGSFYTASSQVPYQQPGQTWLISAPNPCVFNVPPSTYTVSCSTELAGDWSPADDKKTGTVTVRVQTETRDVGTTVILAPSGTVGVGANVTPACSVYNYGTTTEGYSVRMKIGTTYNTAVSVTGHAPLTRRYVTFSAWTASELGSLAVSCSTELGADQVHGNDKRTGSVTVQAGDVGVTRIAAPVGTIDSGSPVTPACSVYNYGLSAAATYQVRMRIGAFYNNPQTVTGHAPGMARYVTFAASANWPRGSHAVSCSTELSGDAVPGNDRQTGVVFARVLDAEVLVITAPTGAVDSGTTVAPEASVRNDGNMPATFDVEFLIGSWSDTKSVTLDPDSTHVVTFSDWAALPRGDLTTKCTTRLVGDMAPGNDRRTGSVSVAVHDVSAGAIVAPSGSVAPGTVVPRCRVRNRGTARESALILFSISSTPPYLESLSLGLGLPVGQDTIVSFPSWTATTGDYVAACSTYLASDQVPANNVVSQQFTVTSVHIGWEARADVPGGMRQKKVKDGGCLSYQVEQSYGHVYALKGNGTYEFYRYDGEANTWETKESIPAIGSTGKKKAVKKGGSMIALEGRLYATKGNNTCEFWEYNPTGGARRTTDAYPWQELAGVPPGAKKLKDGVSIVGVTANETSYVYLLKGAATVEFYRYNVLTNAWVAMPDAPTGSSTKGYKSGSCLAGDGDHTIFLLKASYNEFYSYDVNGKTWTTRTAMPFIGAGGKKKKVKDGAGIAYNRGRIYALKGGNTQEFWTYQADSDRWAQSDDVPIGAGKRVKGGGALVFGGGVLDQGPALYATKGNNTFEFYDYPLTDFVPQAGSENDFQVATNSRVAVGKPLLQIAPNPFTSTTSIRYTLARAGNVNLRLYDVTGKLVSTLASGYHNAGTSSFIVHRSSLSSGIYVLKLESEGQSLTRKLVIK
jgi:hypothetical protein